MTIVGVISDTHGSLPIAAYSALANCDYIIHAGDIGDPAVLRELKTLAPVTAVLGNNDFSEYGEDVQRYARVTVDGVKFLVAHYPQSVDLSRPRAAALAPGDPIPDVCVHGHTHIPRLEFGKNARPASFIVNPGSATWPRGGSASSIAKIFIDSGAIQGIQIETLSGECVMSVGSMA